MKKKTLSNDIIQCLGVFFALLKVKKKKFCVILFYKVRINETCPNLIFFITKILLMYKM